MSIARAILDGDATKDGTVAVLSSRRTVGLLRGLERRFNETDSQAFATVTSLQCGYGITDFELSFLSELFSKLSRLVLSGSKYLTAKGMFCLNSLPVLEKLEIIDCKNVHNRGLKDLSGLALKKLTLRKLDWLTTEGLQSLNVERLEYLEITNCPKISDVSLSVLREWPIQQLVLDIDCVTQVGILFLCQLPKLKELTVCGRPLEMSVWEKLLTVKKQLNLNRLVLKRS